MLCLKPFLFFGELIQIDKFKARTNNYNTNSYSSKPSVDGQYIKLIHKFNNKNTW